MALMKGEPEANVFIASPAEAATGASSAAADGVTGAVLYGVYLEGIAALHWVLLGQEFEPDGVDLAILGTHKEVFVYTELHGGWLFQFPDELVQRLSSISDTNRRAIAEKWSKVFQDDGQLPGLDQADRALAQIIGLARTSLHLKQPLFWRQESC